MEKTLDNVKVTCNTDTITDAELVAYIARGREKSKIKLIGVDVQIDGEYADVSYTYDKVNFDRIRRITGYLVGTLDRFNNGKRAEVEDRVKHSLSDDCEDVYVDEPLTKSA